MAATQAAVALAPLSIAQGRALGLVRQRYQSHDQADTAGTSARLWRRLSSAAISLISSYTTSIRNRIANISIGLGMAVCI